MKTNLFALDVTSEEDDVLNSLRSKAYSKLQKYFLQAF